MAKLVDAGIDYLRVTSEAARDSNKMEEEFLRISREDTKLGYKEHAAGAFGFWGRANRHVLLAQKDTWRMLQVTGKAAKPLTRIISRESNCTRLDVQVTVQLDDISAQEYLRALHEELLARPKGEGRPARVRAIVTNGEVETIYVGSRLSDWYLRIYDKGKETKEKEWENCIRFELEIKGRASKAIWRYMAENGKGIGFLISVLKGKYLEHGITIPDIDNWQARPFRVVKEKTGTERTMAWLMRQVAPAFLTISCEIGWFQPLVAVLDKTLYPAEIASISRNLAREWGG